MPDQPAFISGSKVYLRPLERSDLNERYLNWLNDPEVTRYLETGAFPTTSQDLEKFYAKVTSSSTEVIFCHRGQEVTQAHWQRQAGPNPLGAPAGDVRPF